MINPQCKQCGAPMVLLNHDIDDSYYKCDRCIIVVGLNRNMEKLKAEAAPEPPPTLAGFDPVRFSAIAQESVDAIRELTKVLKAATAYTKPTKKKQPRRRYERN